MTLRNQKIRKTISRERPRKRISKAFKLLTSLLNLAANQKSYVHADLNIFA